MITLKLYYTKNCSSHIPKLQDQINSLNIICQGIHGYFNSKQKVRISMNKMLTKCHPSNQPYIRVRVMVLNTTFNNISAISWWYVLLVEETGVHRNNHRTCCKSVTNIITQCCMKYTLPWSGFKPTMLVVMGTDCIGSFKSNYRTITTMTTLAIYHMYWDSKIQVNYPSQQRPSLSYGYFFHNEWPCKTMTTV